MLTVHIASRGVHYLLLIDPAAGLIIFYLLSKPFRHLFRMFNAVNCIFMLYYFPYLHQRCYCKNRTDDPVHQRLPGIERIYHQPAAKNKNTVAGKSSECNAEDVHVIKTSFWQ